MTATGTPAGARVPGGYAIIPRTMRKALLCAVALGLVLGCGKKQPPKTAETEPVNPDDTTKTESTSKPESTSEGDKDKPEAPKKDECTGLEIADLMDALQKSACEVPSPKPDDKPLEPKDKLDIKVSTSSAKIAPGGHVDILVTFTNKSKDNLPLMFTIDPLPRFEVEAYDAKGTKRVEMPAKSPPPLPAGVAPRVPGEAKTARVTLAANGTAKIRVGWDAVKTRWAPEKLKGTPPEKGYPRVASGPLPKGKYTIRVVMPLVGVFEGVDHEVSAPRVPIEVGK